MAALSGSLLTEAGPGPGRDDTGDDTGSQISDLLAEPG